MPRTVRRTLYRAGNAEDAALVKRVRTRLGLTQGELASRLGVSQGAVSHVETRYNGLDRVMRQAMRHMLASQRAAEMVEGRPIPTCRAMGGMDPDAFFRHLPTCARCLARSWNWRNP